MVGERLTHTHWSGYGNFYLQGLPGRSAGLAELPPNSLLGWTVGVTGGWDVRAGSQLGPYGVEIVVLPDHPGGPEEQWEDVVEVDVVGTGDVAIADLEDGPEAWLSTRPGEYRMRVSARGRARSEGNADTDDDSDAEVEPVEHYLIQLWGRAGSLPPAVLRDSAPPGVTGSADGRELSGLDWLLQEITDDAADEPMVPVDEHDDEPNPGSLTQGYCDIAPVVLYSTAGGEFLATGSTVKADVGAVIDELDARRSVEVDWVTLEVTVRARSGTAATIVFFNPDFGRSAGPRDQITCPAALAVVRDEIDVAVSMDRTVSFAGTGPSACRVEVAVLGYHWFDETDDGDD